MRMRVLIVGVLLAVIGLGGYALYQASATELVAEQRDDTLCRAKLSNWLMRFEELAKPEKERWKSYRSYMGECVR